jgi:NAD(P)-dependent dehydrogenase (short-subunit alcohol dehydrogenase family)
VLAKELGPNGIRVNTVVPGWMWGPSVERYFEMRAKRDGTSVDEQRRAITTQIALGRIPTDDDCADAVVFFASDLSCAVTGQSLDVNGGEVFH